MSRKRRNCDIDEAIYSFGIQEVYHSDDEEEKADFVVRECLAGPSTPNQPDASFNHDAYESQNDHDYDMNEENVLLPDAEEVFILEDPTMNDKSSETSDCDKRRDILLRICAFLYNENFSKRQVEVVLEIAEMVTGFPSHFSAAEIERTISDCFQSTFKPETTIYCSSCGTKMSTSSELCSNSACRLHEKNVTRGSSFERNSVLTLAIRPQIQRIMDQHAESLITLHRLHHLSESSGVAYDDLTTIGASQTYRQFMENEQSYSEKRLRIPLSLSYDGFKPRRHSKLEVTPLYLRIEGLVTEEKRKPENVVLAAVHIGPKGVYYTDGDTFSTRLKHEISAINRNRIRTIFQNETWEMELVLFCGISDMKGIRNAIGLPNWQSIDGCLKCTVVGERIGRVVSFFSEGRNERRNEDSFAELVGENIKISSLLTLIHPSSYVIDELHLFSQGIAKNLFRDILTTDTMWPGLKIAPKTINEIQSCLSNVKNPTFARAFLLSVKKFGLLTGSEMRQLSLVLFVMLGVSDTYENLQLRIFLILMACFTREMMGVSKHEDIVWLRDVAASLKKIHGEENKRTFTLKCHYFYEHAIEEIETMGNLRSTSTADFERFHRELQVGNNNFSTSILDMIKRFVTKFQLNTIAGLSKALKTQHAVEGLLRNVIENISELDECERVTEKVLKNAGFCLYSKVNIDAKTLTSRSWKRKTTTQNNLVTILDNGILEFVEIFAFAQRGSFWLILGRPFIVKDTFEELITLGNEKQIEPSILNSLIACSLNSSWSKIVLGEQKLRAFHLENFQKNFIEVSYQNKKFLFIVD